jgi:hypothetical protein
MNDHNSTLISTTIHIMFKKGSEEYIKKLINDIKYEQKDYSLKDRENKELLEN